MTLFEAYGELDIETRAYMVMARMIDPKSTDRLVRELADNIRKTKELMQKSSQG